MIDTLIKVWALHFLFGLFLYVGFNTVLYKRSQHVKVVEGGNILNSSRTKFQLFILSQIPFLNMGMLMTIGFLASLNDFEFMNLLNNNKKGVRFEIK